MAKTPTYTVRVDDELKALIQEEARMFGVKGWTAMLVILARQHLRAKEKVE